MRPVLLGASSAIPLLVVATLFAQTGLTGAAFEGVVRDPSGQPVAGAAVEATETGTGIARKTRTDAHGNYSLAALPSGSYRLRVSADGYAPVVRENLGARVGEVLTVHVTLAVGFAESVSVEAPLQVDLRAGPEVSTVVGRSWIEGLPTNGRDYVAFALLTPGVVAERTPPTGPTMSSGLSFAGQRARSNHVMVDGFDNDEVFTGAVAAAFSQDSVLEFQVIAASATPEFGHASGGTVNTVTRSGGNEVRGGAYLFFRDDALNAREHFETRDVFGAPIAAAKTPFRQTQWGATLGGPVRKDRTFFFLSYEQLDRDAHNFVTIDPTVAKALEGLGLSAEVGPAPYAVGTRSGLLRLDHSSSPEHRLLFRAHFAKRSDESVEPFGGIVARSHGVAQARRDWGLAFGKTDIFGSGAISEARLQVVRGEQTVHSLDPRCGGPCDGPEDGGPEVTIAGLAVAGRQLNTPQDRSNLGLQLSETLTFSRGRHLLKGGFDLGVTWWDGVLAQDFGGRYVFTALPPTPGLTEVPLSAFQAFEAGLPAFYFQGYGDPTAEGTSRQFSIFAQDQWRVSPRLEVVAGLRYQRYDLGLPRLTVSAPAGTSLRYDVPSRGNLAPRLSLAFDPTGHGRTSVRGSAGVFYEDPLLAVALVSQIVNGQGLLLSQSGLAGAAEGWRAANHRLAGPASAFPSVVQVAGPGFRAPWSRQLSAGLTQDLGPDLRLTLDFLGVRGRAQIGVVDYNPIVPALGPGRRPNDVGGQAGTSASVNQFTNYGEGAYDGLAIGLRKKMSHGFEALVSYTFSSAEDLGSDMFGQANVAEDSGLGRDPQDPAGLPVGFAPEAFRGPAAADQRHRFVFAGLVELPWRLRLSGIVTVGSGRPFTALSGVDSNRNGLAATDRARRDPADPGSRVERNSERLPATATLDARLSRRIALFRRAAVEVMAEGFNLLNRVNYSDVNNVFGPGAFPGQPATDAAGRATYGLYTKAYPPRQVQLAARLSF